jgi:ribonuclease P protein component
LPPVGAAWLALRGDAAKALLSAPVVARSEHFVFHRATMPVAKDLSTDAAPSRTPSVDKSAAPGLAIMLPKRHARRAVTRNLIRRQIREALRAQPRALGQAHCLVRLRRPFAAAEFHSAASLALRATVRGEVTQLCLDAERLR